MPSSVSPDKLTHRITKPGFKDPKLLIGLALIAASILSVFAVVRGMNKTETYYAASSDIRVGQRLSAEHFRPVQVRLSESSGHYLRSLDDLHEQNVAIDNITAGELVSTHDLSEADPHHRREVTVIVNSAVAQGFTAGQHVDIWASAQATKGVGYDAPQRVASQAQISTVTSEDSLIGGTGESAVRMLISSKELAPVLEAVNNENKINLVPTSYESGQEEDR
ncbi:hypothetical protein VVR12_00690 [Rothia sp. LK2588]|uniref:SAF domain-containing protein n=1 Tax=Rothia sp. LK2588 TaxID=3114369 RepID=UPI0034CD577A